MKVTLENIEELWDATLSTIQEKLSKPSFDTWLKNTKALHLEKNTLVITAPNEFTKDWLETQYTDLITQTLEEITGSNLNAKFIIPDSVEEPSDQKPMPKPNIDAKTPDSPKSMLNDKYTFDTFVIGAGNRFAHAASLAVAEAPAKAYNPLFIYGGVGLGKTHLILMFTSRWIANPH